MSRLSYLIPTGTPIISSFFGYDLVLCILAIPLSSQVTCDRWVWDSSDNGGAKPSRIYRFLAANSVVDRNVAPGLNWKAFSACKKGDGVAEIGLLSKSACTLAPVIHVRPF